MAYVKHNWVTNEVITEALLDHLETQYDEAKADLDAHIADLAAHVALEATVARFQANAGTGTIANPDRINDNNTGTGSTAAVQNMYAEVDYDKVVCIRRWRYFGWAGQVGDGDWKVQFYNLETHAWVDWVTGIPTRAATWTGFTTETEVHTDKIRVVATTLDSAPNSTYGEWEIIY